MNSPYDLPAVVPPPTDSIFERQDAKNLYVLGFMAQNAKKSQTSDADYTLAASGMSPDEIDQYHEQTRAAADAQEQDQAAHDIVTRTMSLPLDQYTKIMGQLQQEMANQPVRQDAGPPRLNNTQLALGILSTLLDTHHAAQNAGAVLQSGVNAKNAEQQQNDQTFQIQTAQHQERIGSLERMAALQQAVDYHAAQLEDKRRAAAADLEQTQRMNLNRAQERYNSANTPQEKIQAGKYYNSLVDEYRLDPSLKHSDQGMQVDAQLAAAENIPKAAAVLRNSINEVADFGEVGDEQAKGLEAQRQALASAYGIDPRALGEIPNGTNYKNRALDARRQALADAMSRFNQTLDFKKDAWAQTIADKQANYDLARERLDWYEKSIQNGHELGTERIALEKRGQDLRKAVQDAAAKASDAAEKQITRLRADLAGVTSQISALSPKDSKVAGLKAKQSDIEGKINYWTRSQMEYVPVNGVPVKNPDYQAPAAPQNPHAPVNPFSGPIGVSPSPPPRRKTRQTGARLPKGATLTRPDGTVVKG